MISSDGSVSVRALVATELVREAIARHRTAPTASMALGRALMGTLLLATEAQNGERVQLQIRGDGPLGTVTVTAASEGTVRGYAAHPEANPPPRDGALDVAAAIGRGTLAVERNHPSWKQPYSGVVPLVTSTVAQDLAHYLLESEQKPSAVALGVYLGAGGRVEAAGGYLVQSLPGASDAALAGIERRVAETWNLSEQVRDGASADRIGDGLLVELGSEAYSRLEPRFACPCSVERVQRAAALLGRAELREIAEGGEDLEVRCAFCAEVYRLTPSQVAALSPAHS
jgi:molecular chaperone Hsp33